jgi:transcriptional regulator with XRE-family HTH domain
MDIRRLVGSNVRRCREASGFSQEDLAARIGVDQGYVSRLEAGARNPTIVTVWHTAEALGVEPVELFQASEPIDKNQKAKARRRR